jgi:hypothetical protein
MPTYTRRASGNGLNRERGARLGADRTGLAGELDDLSDAVFLLAGLLGVDLQLAVAAVRCAGREPATWEECRALGLDPETAEPLDESGLS